MDKKSIEDISALTPIQEGMLFHYLKSPGSDHYFEQLSLEISGDIDVGTFEKAWNAVIESNEMLRTVFRWEGVENPIQIILKEHKLQPKYYDFSEIKSGQKKRRLEKIKRGDREEKFDLRQVPFRVILCKLEADRYEMTISNHHILYDGWSNGVILKELFKAYDELSKENENPVVPSGKVKFKEFVKWIRGRETGEQYKFWQEYLKGFDGPTGIRKNGAYDTTVNNAGRFSTGFSRDVSQKVDKFVKENNLTMAPLIYGVWAFLLQRYNNCDDVVFGTTVSGRPPALKGIEDAVGLFINTVPLRVQFPADETAVNALYRIEKMMLTRKEYEYTSLLAIKECSETDSKSKLFDSIVVLENYPIDGWLKKQMKKQKGMIVPRSYSMFERTHYALTLQVTPFDGIEISFNYDTALLNEAAVIKLAHRFKNVTRAVITYPGRMVSEIDILSEEEKKQIIYEFNDTKADYPEDKTIHELFEAQAARTPDHIAVVVVGSRSSHTSYMTHLTYNHLNKKAGRLASRLKQKGVTADTPVGLTAHHSLEMIIGILGILKAGAAYLPIDPDYPKERVDYVLKDSAAGFLVSGLKGECEIARLNHVPQNVPAHPTQPNRLAYVIYTSGSTGRPKGVMVGHRNVIRLVKNTNYIHFEAHDRVLQTGAVEFDASTFEIWGALLNGLSLYLTSKENILNPLQLKKIIAGNRITTMWLSSPLFNQLVQSDVSLFAGLRNLLVGGDVLSPAHIDKTRKRFPRLNIVNGYGPTENTTFSTTFLITEEYKEGIPIGKPIANSGAYIVDKRGKLQPIGIPGELWVEGDGVSRGYLNNPELTAEKFSRGAAPPLITPYPPITSAGTPGPLTSFYRTGDLARWLPDGNIEFLGRMDEQVKLRGFRIELGEIENRLVKHEYIKEAVVIAKRDKAGDKSLAAYFVSDRDIPGGELREYLSGVLPDYMVPSYFARLGNIPLTPNGKIDRKALPAPVFTSAGEYVPPTGTLEKKLVEIYSDVLGGKVLPGAVGIDDNFFHLGGHSLKAMRLTARLHKEFRVSVPLDEVFKRPTVRQLSRYIRESEKSIYASVEPVERKHYYSPSSAQERLYVLQQMEPASTVYNITDAMTLEGALDKEKIEETFKKLIQRHESLRTSFHVVGEEPVQRVHHRVEFGIEYYDLAANTDEDTRIKDFIRPFDLGRAPLFRAGLIRVEDEKHILLVDMHHIIADGSSVPLLIKDFTDLYNGKVLPELEIQYKDFSEWRNRIRRVEAVKQQEIFWLNEFRDEIPVLELPTDFSRPPARSFEGAGVSFDLTPALTGRLEALALETGTTMYMVLLAAYSVLLSKLSSREDIVIGSPTAGRRHADLEKIIGMFVNTLALRTHPSGKKTFRRFLAEIKEKTLIAFENQDYQYDDLVEQVVANRDVSRNPVFDTMFVLQNVETVEIAIPGLKLSAYNHRLETTKFDLTLIGVQAEDKLQFTLEYSTRLFKRATVERFIEFYKTLISVILSAGEKDIRISALGIIPDEEKRRILFDFNDTEAVFPKDKTIHRLFEDQVEKTPNRIAAVESPRSLQLSYRGLNEKANRLAGHLIRKGAGPHTIVGIMVERSINMLAGILGILKAGGAYLPVNISNPPERTRYILADSGVKLLLTREDFEKGLDSYSNSYGNKNPGNTAASGDLLYVIYTSGSTGNPRGVLIRHRGFVNMVYSHKQIFEMEPRPRRSQVAAPDFDAMAFETWPCLLSGAALYIADNETRMDPAKMKSWLIRHEITLSFQPTYMAGQLLLESWPGSGVALRVLQAAGERLTQFPRHPYPFVLYNLYGPTESTVWATWAEVKVNTGTADPASGMYPVIGKPLNNLRIYITDPDLDIRPLGVPGELCIAGEGPAVGYLNNPELTAEKFSRGAASSFITPYPLPFTPFYRTGDLARWLPDGNIEFLGRIDHQVKIRGFRVELREIESELLDHEGIKDAVVTAKVGERGDNYLCAYIVSDKNPSVPGLREYLSRRLPDYMIPPFFVFLDRIPLTPGGKVDRKRLPEPELTGTDTYVAPRDRVEEKLVEIWNRVLGEDVPISDIGIDDNFFQLGGHSLKATLLAGKIQKELEIAIPLTGIFRNPTIRGLSEYIKSEAKEKYNSIKEAEIIDYYQLSSAQERLYVLDQVVSNIHTAYNIPYALSIEGELDKQRFEDTFRALIKRHENFRTSFHMVGGEPRQRIHDNVEFQIEYYSAHSADSVQDIIDDFIRPFDLSGAPLLRIALIALEKDKQVMVLDIHHIIADAVSMRIMIQEFVELYAGKELPRVPLQYKDFVEWQRDAVETGMLKKQEDYWTERFRGELPVLDLPADYPRSAAPGFEGAQIFFSIDRELTGKIREILSGTTTTLYILLLCVYNILLSRYSGQEDIVVGIISSGRTHPDTENILGVFINTLAIRSFPTGTKTFEEFLEEVKQDALDAYENQDYSFEKLVEKLKISGTFNRNPLVDVLLVSENVDAPELRIEGVKFSPYDFVHRVSHVDMIFYLLEDKEEIKMMLEYSTALFKPSTAESFTRRYIEVLKQVVEDREIPLENIGISTELIDAKPGTGYDAYVGFDF